MDGRERERERYKESTGRVVMWRQMNNYNSFTLEATFSLTILNKVCKRKGQRVGSGQRFTETSRETERGRERTGVDKTREERYEEKDKREYRVGTE